MENFGQKVGMRSNLYCLVMSLLQWLTARFSSLHHLLLPFPLIVVVIVS